MQAIAAQHNINRNTVRRILHGENESKQQEIADRMEYFLGGACGPGSGCYRTHAVHRDDGNTRVLHDLGVHELSTADPLDILIAEEEADAYGT